MSDMSLSDWLEETYDIEMLKFSDQVMSVQDAVRVSGYPRNEFVKTIVLIHKDDGTIVTATITAGSRVDKVKLMDGVNGKRWRMATPEEVLENTGYPVGGVPPIGLPSGLTRYVDPRVLKKKYIIGGGGTTLSLIRFNPNLIVQDGVEIKIISKG